MVIGVLTKCIKCGDLGRSCTLPYVCYKCRPAYDKEIEERKLKSEKLKKKNKKKFLSNYRI